MRTHSVNMAPSSLAAYQMAKHIKSAGGSVALDTFIARRPALEIKLVAATGASSRYDIRVDGESVASMLIECGDEETGRKVTFTPKEGWPQ